MGVLSAQQKHDFNKMNRRSSRSTLGDVIEKTHYVRGKYSFATQGGAVGAVNLLRDLADSTSTVVVPDNAIITKVMIDIKTAIVSTGGTGTLALDSEGAGDLLAAVDGDTLSGINAGVPVGTAATSIKMTADNTLTATIATAVFTAGIFDVFVEYYLGS